MKRVLSAIIMCIGLAMFLYPSIAQYILDKNTEEYVADYNETYFSDSDENSDTNNNIELYNEILQYNQEIYENGQSGLLDAWNYEQTPVDISGLSSDEFGYIEIPSMDVTLPLYLGTSSENLAKGAAVLGQTSIPIGGTNTNSVIAGHRGWSTGAFFKKIEKISIGDYVYVTNPWETLTYRVESIDIINPTDIDKVKIQEGKDMITLLTCHPYRSHGNKYRYLVYCVRDESGNSSSSNESVGDTIVSTDGITYSTSESEIELEELVQKIGFCLIFGLIFISILKRIIYKFVI